MTNIFFFRKFKNSNFYFFDVQNLSAEEFKLMVKFSCLHCWFVGVFVSLFDWLPVCLFVLTGRSMRRHTLSPDGTKLEQNAQTRLKILHKACFLIGQWTCYRERNIIDDIRRRKIRPWPLPTNLVEQFQYHLLGQAKEESFSFYHVFIQTWNTFSVEEYVACWIRQTFFFLNWNGEVLPDLTNFPQAIFSWNFTLGTQSYTYHMG